MTPKTSRTRHFLSLRDRSRRELAALLERARVLKAGSEGGRELPLAGKTLGMIFRKHSTRTRVSFEVGMFHLGGHAIVLPTAETHLGRGEHSEGFGDTARVLSRYVDGIMIRTFDHAEPEALARHGSVPVINGLTDLLHPCQLLADLLTVQEAFGAGFGGLRVAWVGDGNNMANSWIEAASILGFELSLAVPRGYAPDARILQEAEAAEAAVQLLEDPVGAVEGAHVVCTDTWASMGQEEDLAARLRVFERFRVTRALMARAEPEAIFLHCLPAHRGQEVTDEVIDGPRSRVLDEAENRLHVQKVLLIELLA